uniref:Uncharacterized protein n=1 Tax=viral metagenome TaxID=1070528 RepID=A0A6C0AED0_9ZZZZ
MSDIVSFFLGMLTIILLLLIFWYPSTMISSFKEIYKNSICYNICTG